MYICADRASNEFIGVAKTAKPSEMSFSPLLPAAGGSNMLRTESPAVSLLGFGDSHSQGCKRSSQLRFRQPFRHKRVSCATEQGTKHSQYTRPKKKRSKIFIQSDGKEHLGSALDRQPNRPFPGPPSGQGPPLRVLPVGGLGEIGMNCMLVGVYDRYILIDAGLMFPDFTDLGMAKILPDTTFLAEWRDKIEAVVITHGHEDHIGALPWVVPALDPNTPVYGGPFTMQLVRRRLTEYNLFNEKRFKTFKMGETFKAGPFSCSPLRVTHSIPDCCGLILRSEHGTIVHTGDWKIEENPVDGKQFDRTFFEKIGREGATLFMSDSTNVLSPGRTVSEASVEKRIMQRVEGHRGKGRVISTQFASNIHRLAAVKKAADAAGRRLCFVGMSLNTYLEAAHKEGMAPFDPKELIPVGELDNHDPNKVMVITTGSQAEPRAALCLASRGGSPLLKLRSSDLLLYSAKVIPGNDTKVMHMMNNVSSLGVQIAMGASEGLHTSGHAYRDELTEVMKLVKPQHFLPVHGEYTFLKAHAAMARDIGIKNTSVIRNGQMIGVHHRRNGNVVSTTGASVKGMQMLGEVKLRSLYNDGGKGTGDDQEMGIEERQQLALEGIVVAAIDVMRPSSGAAQQQSRQANDLTDIYQPGALKAQIRVTTRAMWVGKDRLLALLHRSADIAVKRLPADAALMTIEKAVAEACKKACKEFNNRTPEVIVIAHEKNPRDGAVAQASQEQKKIALEKAQRDHQQKQAPTEDLLMSNTAIKQQQIVQQHELQRQLEQIANAAPQQQPGQQQPPQQQKTQLSAAQADLMQQSKATQQKARGRPKKSDSATTVKKAAPRKTTAKIKAVPGSAEGPGALTDLPEGLLHQRKASNPRESPDGAGDVAYD